MELERGLNRISANVEISSATAQVRQEQANAAETRGGRAHGRREWVSLAAIALLGAVGLMPALLSLWDVWTNDPLRSIGMLIVAAAIVLVLRAWKQCGWERRGAWWGLFPIVLSYALSDCSRLISWRFVAGGLHLNLLAPKFALYSYASGVILLFAGPRVWRKAWFPLALFLCAQPVPTMSSRLLDLPLQSLSARIARSFANSIGFPPSDHELLRLMFTPQFGMFIAPGCDGLRGAVTLGYAALIAGYLKRVPARRWILYVTGAVFLGYLFNLIRLCALVLYYRVAVGHPALENAAAMADYVIGGCLILAATLLFLRVMTSKPGVAVDEEEGRMRGEFRGAERSGLVDAKTAVFAAAALLFATPGVIALRDYRKSFAATVHDGGVSMAQLDALMPSRLGDYTMSRVWQEQANGRVAVESAAYSISGADEVVLGVWLPPSPHSMHESWRARGEDPQVRAERSFATAGGQTVAFDTAFYNDGVTDSLAGNAFCTPTSCTTSQHDERMRLEFSLNPIDFKTRGVRAVSIFFRIETPHNGAPPTAVREQLTAEAQRFLAGVDFRQLSHEFQ